MEPFREEQPEQQEQLAATEALMPVVCQCMGQVVVAVVLD
jgi:hypothetical protein